ncbi:MAG: ABC transporter permease [Rhodobacteraceae bacterium]|nr:ABC transporter permease [Paracoccaceae bacterium]
MFSNTLMMAIREIRRNLMRSGLTVLGIVIGVAAVIIIVTLGAGTQVQVQGEISKMGNNMLTLMPGGERRMGGISGSAPAFTAADVLALRREIPDVAAVAPVSLRRYQAVVGNVNRRPQVMGTDNAFIPVRNWQVVDGRSFTPAEVRFGRMSCIIGATIKNEMFPSENPIGAKIRIKNTTCEVIGVLESKGTAMFGGDQDDIIVVPLIAFQRRLSGADRIDQIYLSAADLSLIDKVKSDVEKIMRERRKIPDDGALDFNVADMREVSSAMGNVTGMLTGFLSAIAAVSLLVGGIGIMNIMLVSVTERTREIGIRLAIGALEKEVMLQFLVEAAMLSGFGGLIGIGFGLMVVALGAPALNVPFILQPGTIFIAFVFSAAVGVVFGFVPARRAAQLDPIDALRHE